MKKKQSWKTSAGGIGMILTAAGMIIKAYADGDPATVPDWPVLMPQIMGGLALLCARDNKVSSEEAGAK